MKTAVASLPSDPARRILLAQIATLLRQPLRWVGKR